MLCIAISSADERQRSCARRRCRWPTRLRTLKYLVPPLVVFGIVMGSLYFGMATTTESAALGVIAALFFVWQSGKLSWDVLRTCFSRPRGSAA